MLEIDRETKIALVFLLILVLVVLGTGYLLSN